MAQPNGASIDDSTALVVIPMPLDAATIDLAKSLALSSSTMNAARPNLTSRTSAESPSAAFFETIEDVMRGIESIVPVTSLRAYILRSAGTSLSVWPTIAKPISRICACISSESISTLNPGILSSLSNVPPV